MMRALLCASKCTNIRWTSLPAIDGAAARAEGPQAAPCRPRALERGTSGVLRGEGFDVRELRVQLARFTLLALALHRRAVPPLVPCEIPTMEVPPKLQNDALLFKLTEVTSCSANARSVAAPRRDRPTGGVARGAPRHAGDAGDEW